jgi:hypothetical protein
LFRRCRCGFDYCYDCGGPHPDCFCREPNNGHGFGWDLPVDANTPVGNDGFEVYDEVAWAVAAEVDTQAQPDTHNTNYYGYGEEEEEYEETIRAPLPPDRGYWGETADTYQTFPDEEVADELPEDQKENDTAGTLIEDEIVFGPLSEARWKRMDLVEEIENHKHLGHGTRQYKWNNMGGPGQCEYCRDFMSRYLLRCPDCHLGLCRMCTRWIG